MLQNDDFDTSFMCSANWTLCKLQYSAQQKYMYYCWYQGDGSITHYAVSHLIVDSNCWDSLLFQFFKKEKEKKDANLESSETPLFSSFSHGLSMPKAGIVHKTTLASNPVRNLHAF